MWWQYSVGSGSDASGSGSSSSVEVVVIVVEVEEVVVILLVKQQFKFTEKHDKNYETNNKAHTHAPRMYTPMYYEPQITIEFN